MQDSHGQDTIGAPVADPEQDCTLVGGKQNETHTIIRFKRPLDTCDSKHDLKLGVSSVDNADFFIVSIILFSVLSTWYLCLG